MGPRKNSRDKTLPSIPRANSSTSTTSNSSRTARDTIEQSTSRTLIEDSIMPPPPVPSNRSKLPSSPSPGVDSLKKASERQSKASKKARDSPLISVSSSSSTHSNLVDLVNPLRLDPGETEPMTEGGEKGSFSSLGLSNSRSGASPGEEVLEEWASADLEEGEGTNEQNVRGRNGNGKEVGNLSTKSGKSIFGIKRSRSNLRMFGGKGDQGDQAIPTQEKDTVVPRRGSDTSSIFDPRASTSSQSTTHSQPYFSHNSVSSSQSQNPNVAGRIGGWFSSMLPSTHSTTNLPVSTHETSSATTSLLPSTPNKLFTFPSPSLNRVSTTPKKSNGSTTSNSGGGRLGPLDRMLDKAVQYFLDTDSNADQCEEDIWVLGVRHPGFSPPVDSSVMTSEASSDDTRSTTSTNDEKKKRRKGGGIGLNFGSRQNSKNGKNRILEEQLTEGVEIASSPSSSIVSSPIVSPQNSFHLSLPSTQPPTTTNGWPSQFYHDFYSRIALTYRAGFPPIPCSPGPSSGGVHAVFNSLSMSIGRGSNSRTADGLSSDTGWGCMLRTGQSLLANTLITIHLGRDWRRSLPQMQLHQNTSHINNAHSPSSSPPQFTQPLFQADYARILSLFIDDPSPLAPFSVHRFALMGKQLGKEVGEWFGPSTAAGAIKSLVNEFEPAGLKVCSVVDGTVYKSEVELASGGSEGKNWSKPVLILIGLRLGIDGVNPIYNEGIKAIFQFPQSMGIAGGRPSSSYYFVGAQANSLLYIDPHHPRPSIPLRNPPPDLFAPAQFLPLSTGSINIASASGESSIAFPTTKSSNTITEDKLNRDRSRLGDYLIDAYPDTALRSYHTEKVRKMSIASLDPSMLLGFLIQDEDDWEDFASRVKELNNDHRPIFALADTLPAWMGRSVGTASGTISISKVGSSVEGDLDPGVESFSEPDDWELDSSESINSPPSGQSHIEFGEGAGDEEAVVKVEEEEEWEEAPTGSTGDHEFTSPSPTTPLTRKEEVSEDSTRTRTQSWYSVQSMRPEGESLVVVSPLTPSHSTYFSNLSLANSTPLPPSPVQIPSIDSHFSVDISTGRTGGAGVLVKARSDATIEFEKREEGWEGVGLKRMNSSKEGGKDVLEGNVC